MCNCKNEVSELKNMIVAQQSKVNQLTSQVNSLIVLSPQSASHIILPLFHADDLAYFNLATGLGTDKWLGWGVCNGSTYSLPQGGTITTPQITDAIPAGGGNLYVIGNVSAPKLATLNGTVKLIGLLYVMKLY